MDNKRLNIFSVKMEKKTKGKLKVHLKVFLVDLLKIDLFIIF